jgi:hypothetical protein
MEREQRTHVFGKSDRRRKAGSKDFISSRPYTLSLKAILFLLPSTYSPTTSEKRDVRNDSDTRLSKSDAS